MKIIPLFILCSLVFFSRGFPQTFQREGKIEDTDQDGFYNILLEPPITAHLRQDFGDIRLCNRSGKEIPFIIRQEKAGSFTTLFKTYEVREKTIVPNCCTVLILYNSGKNKISNISLIIKNADVKKKAQLSGSDDGSNWYIIKDNILLEYINNTNDAWEIKVLDFPVSDYAYYKLYINDSLTPPLNIVKAGYYDTWQEEEKYVTLPTPVTRQIDSSNRKSYIYFTFNASYTIDKMQFKTQGEAYYFRNAQLCSIRVKKGKTFLHPIENITLRSNHDNLFTFTALYEKQLCLIIDNLDNAPLHLSSATAFQLVSYLTFYAKKRETPIIKFGNKTLESPRYDLEHFRDSIPENIKILEVKEIHHPEQDSKHSEHFFQSTIWIWSAIAGIVLLLGYMSFRMIREIKEQ
jgi:hypothetical protein